MAILVPDDQTHPLKTPRTSLDDGAERCHPRANAKKPKGRVFNRERYTSERLADGDIFGRSEGPRQLRALNGCDAELKLARLGVVGSGRKRVIGIRRRAELHSEELARRVVVRPFDLEADQSRAGRERRARQDSGQAAPRWRSFDHTTPVYRANFRLRKAVNYLGHAVLAFHVAEDPAFALGAMLPDLASMAGFSIDEVEPRVSAGVRFHHQTDAIFHEAPEFIEGQRFVRQRLLELGVRKGPARAMAHIGIEFMIDAAFVPHEGYLDALALGAKDMGIWRSGGPTASRAAALCDRLYALAWTPHEVSPERLSERLMGALRSRIRLAPLGREATVAAELLAEQRHHYQILAPQIASYVLTKVRAP